MESVIKIDVVSDVVCPWCIIGYKRLQQAIQELGLEDKIELEWQPFELNPNMPAEGENLRQHLANKYGTTPEDSVRARDNLTNLGKEVGFDFDYFDDMKMVNTRDAHVLLQWAEQFGKQTELKLALFTAFFGQRKDVSDRSTLAAILTDIGLDANMGIATLDDPSNADSIEYQESQWHQLGVSSVPTVVFNMESAVTGAQPVEVYKQILTEYAEKLGQ
ncbi:MULTISPECIES: DsbA family oxidoreductase [Vibrio]|uniref:DsbA family oxidoreductase n=1 Tax=Vibrio TaxID=662 RepID=UPI000412C061|nr:MULTISPECIES: DsbA family oxidoreductase [Vibrio]